MLKAPGSELSQNACVNIQIIRGLLQCYSIVKNTFKNFYLTIFDGNKYKQWIKQLKISTLTIKNTVDVQKTCLSLNA